jgi:hypothetical protein
MRRPASKPCEAPGCTRPIEGSPAIIANRRTCGPECSKALRASRRPATLCAVCGKPSGKRTTCGDDCLAELTRRRSTIGVRTPEQRAKRRQQERVKYRGKDKAEVVERLTKQQRGRCASCTLERPLVLDHCHTTGRARAMLCVRCNAALGLLGESPERVVALWRYAKRWAQPALTLTARAV